MSLFQVVGSIAGRIEFCFKVALSPGHPERICWGCERYCPADDLRCGNGTIRTPHPVELFGPDWLEQGLDAVDVLPLRRGEGVEDQTAADELGAQHLLGADGDDGAADQPSDAFFGAAFGFFMAQSADAPDEAGDLSHG